MQKIPLRKSLLIMLLVLTLSVSVFGCTTPSTTGSSSVAGTAPEAADSAPESASTALVSDTPVTFSMLFYDEAVAPYKDTWPSIVEMTKRTNVTLDMQLVTSDWDTKLQTVLYSGDMPDIIARCGDVSELALNGRLLAYSDYMDKLPNFAASVNKFGWEAMIKQLTEEDGKIYTMPLNAYQEKYQAEGLFIMKNILDKNNLKMPTTFDELYEVLKAIKEANPGMHPLVNKYGSRLLLTQIQVGFDAMSNPELNSGFAYNSETDEWTYGVTTDNYKEMLQYLNKLYAEGLLDPEFATLEDSVMQQKIVTGNAVVFPDWITWCIPTYTPEGLANDPDFEILPLPPLAGPRGTRGTAPANQNSFVMCSPVRMEDHPDFDVFLKFIDWLYTEGEGVDVFSWGVEGVSYQVVDGKKEYMPEVQTEKSPDGDKMLQRDFGLWNNCLTFVYDADAILESFGPVSANYLDMLAKEDLIPDPQPRIRLSLEDKDEIKIPASTLTDYKNQMVDSFIMGKVPFSEWDSFVAECNAKGATKLHEVYNKAWKKQNGN